MSYNVGIVGATGMVGQEVIDLLERLDIPCKVLRLMASPRSVGKKVKGIEVEALSKECFAGLEYVLFCAGSEVSKQWVTEAVKQGCTVIDNSSLYRMNEDVPLVVHEVNGEALKGHKGIIANPNCSTTITLMALYPLHKAFGLKRFFAATYQAVSGSGIAAMEELDAQVRGWVEGKGPRKEVYPHPIAFNLLPHVDAFEKNGYTREEMKLVHESRKILGLSRLGVSVTCVRVPVFRAHSVAVNAEFEREVSIEEAREVIEAFPGIELCDEPGANKYPMPLDYSKRMSCGLGRLRKDLVFENGLSLWVVGDQLWKGAALNAVQILKALFGF